MTGSAISLPFTFNEFGEVSYTSEPKKIWQDRVYTAVLTQVGERVLRPGYGTIIQAATFENESVAAEIVDKGVSRAFADYLKDLKLVSVVPFYNVETGVLEVTINYSLPTGEADEVKLTTAILNNSGEIIQEISNG